MRPEEDGRPSLGKVNAVDFLFQILRIVNVVLFVLIVALVVLWVRYKWDERHQQRRGFVIQPSGDAETASIRYTENGQSLWLNGDRKTSVIRIPSPEEWEATMPAWAQGRRDEVVQRIIDHCKKGPYTFEGWEA